MLAKPEPTSSRREVHLLPEHRSRWFTRRRFGLVAGPLLFLACAWWMPDVAPTGNVGLAGERSGALVAATLCLMAVWWMTEVLPLYVTAFIPLVAFPLLNVATIDVAAAPYANKTIFLFFGGFVLATSMERWNLHRRVAIWVISVVGSKPRGVIFGFMAATSFLSLWVSNTATAVMMLPIATSVIKLVESVTKRKDRKFGVGMILAIAYGASIGSFGTPIASPPNGIALGNLAEQGINITFFDWMKVGMPLWAIFLVVGWFLLTFVTYRPEWNEPIPGHKAVMRAELHKLGPFRGPERRVGVIFLICAFTWIAHGFIEEMLHLENTGITDELIAVAVVFVLFLTPVSFKRPGRALMSWGDLRDLPWGILYLFGGGLSVAAQVGASGLAEWIGTQARGLGGLKLFWLLLVCCLLTWIITEFMSNTAAAATLIPIFGSVAKALGYSPVLLAIPVAMAASCAFMMPAGTPPNAVAYSSGMIKITDMNKAGFLIAVVGCIMVAVNMFLWGRLILGV
ncbi:MAG: DASS family sodium-coupled anion symporter [Bifidobacteriaceae bacterium]|jgi:sodium-dependent dicarboxylate transporter 2/3/5|nr:DASS family sodium-coupled anion symporter [Bifidobacteriaceae bacterium]